MSEETDKIESINIYAQKTIEMFSKGYDVELDFDEETVKFLNDFIENSGRKFSDDQQSQLLTMIGSFFGECIRRNHGGKWELVNGSMGIRLESGDVMFPFSKLQKQFEGGEGDTILGFYQMIPMLDMIKQKRAEALKNKKIEN